MQESVSNYHFIRGILLILVFIAGGGWLIYQSIKRSEEPEALLFKWVFTLVVAGVMFYLTRGNIDPSDVIVGAAGGLVLTVVWRRNLAGLFAKPFTSLYDGGNAEIEPRPYYSVAEAKRKRGFYSEAVAEIRSQLARFPTDFQGQMMLAEILAENMNDLPGAELTVQRMADQQGHAPRNIAFAFNSIADWHLKYTQDRDAAQQALEQIIQRFPNTELALLASQRIGHLASTEKLLEAHDRRTIEVPAGISNLGLLHTPTDLAPVEADAATRATELVRHLEQHPFDSEAREKLAIVYADGFKRLDLAQDQLDQLIELPNQPAKSVVHWLNLLADLQIRHEAGYDAVRETLQRIIDRFPMNAAADLARNRIGRIRLELKAVEKKTPVKMGTYEQNIGLKYGAPKHY